MVVEAMDLVLSDNIGNAAVSVVQHDALSAGQYLLECLFLVECSAPANLQLSRFLPATPIRVLIDQKQQSLTEAILHDELVEQLNEIESEQITAFMQGEREAIKELLELAEQEADRKMQALVVTAGGQMLQVLAKEIKRLNALSQFNVNISELEIEALKQKAIDSHGYINDAKLRLDAVRFIIST